MTEDQKRSEEQSWSEREKFWTERERRLTKLAWIWGIVAVLLIADTVLQIIAARS